MHCVARVSVKFKAIFRAHRFILIVIIGGGDHSWVDLRWEMIADEKILDTRVVEKGGFFLFHVFSAVKSKNK